MNEETKEVLSEPQEMTFDGLKRIMFDELNLLRANKVSVARARVTSQLCKRILEAATLDLFAQKLLGDRSPEEIKRLSSM